MIYGEQVYIAIGRAGDQGAYPELIERIFEVLRDALVENFEHVVITDTDNKDGVQYIQASVGE